MYDYRKKKEISERIKSDDFITKDKELLKKYSPESSLLNREPDTAIGQTLAFDLVYTLLDSTTEEEILSNRQGKPATVAPPETKVVPEEKKKATEPKPAAKPAVKKTSTPASAGSASKKKTSSARN